MLAPPGKWAETSGSKQRANEKLSRANPFRSLSLRESAVCCPQSPEFGTLGDQTVHTRHRGQSITRRPRTVCEPLTRFLCARVRLPVATVSRSQSRMPRPPRSRAARRNTSSGAAFRVFAARAFECPVPRNFMCRQAFTPERVPRSCILPYAVFLISTRDRHVVPPLGVLAPSFEERALAQCLHAQCLEFGREPARPRSAV